MSAYRFCRSDDVPLIVDAFNRCNAEPGAVPWRLAVDHMKRLSKEIDLWTSSCMVAFAGRDPIGVLIAAKREPVANLVLHVAVHPEHRRKGHARHMMTSLCQKMAILEPTRMFAEVPAEAAAAQRFLAACGFRPGEPLVDHVFSGATANDAAFDLVDDLSASEVAAAAGMDDASETNRCWQRAPRTILNLRHRARGLGIATDRGLEAYLLYRDGSGNHEPLPFLATAPVPDPLLPSAAPQHGEILAIGGRRPVPALVRPLLDQAARRLDCPLHLPRAHPSEPLAGRLEECGFRPGARALRFERDAAWNTS